MDKFCPRLTDNIKKPVHCQKHSCEFYQQVIGKDPQTGKDVNEWVCSDVMQMRLTLNLIQKTAQNTAAIESFRNEMVTSNNNLLSTMPNLKRIK